MTSDREQRILAGIGRISDPDLLQAIVQTAQDRLGQLQQQRPRVTITFQGETVWAQISGPDGEEKQQRLGDRLTAAAALENAATPPPHAADYELTSAQAHQIRQRDRERVGWWEDDAGQRRYYDVPAHDAARKEWHAISTAARDPRALAYRLPMGVIQAIQKWEGDGWEVEIEGE
jgi:hypothetical protein